MQREEGNRYGSHHGSAQLRLRFGVPFLGFSPRFSVAAAAAAMLRHHLSPVTLNRARSRPEFPIPIAKPTPRDAEGGTTVMIYGNGDEGS